MKYIVLISVVGYVYNHTALIGIPACLLLPTEEPVLGTAGNEGVELTPEKVSHSLIVLHL